MFNPEKYKEIKEKYHINSSNIEAILYGYRYCLNKLLSDEDDNNNDKDYIYSCLYDKANIKYLQKNIILVVIQQMNHILIYFQKYKKHFDEKPNDGCYVCLCKKGYYHCVPSGFPGLQERNMHCPNCDKEIGTIKKE